MNHWQEMGEGEGMWLEQQMAEPVGTWLSVVPQCTPAGSVHSFQGWWRWGGELGLLSGTNM